MSVDAIEKEIVVNIQEEEQEKTSETNNQNSAENIVVEHKDLQSKVVSSNDCKEEPPAKFVEKKSINSLSEDERALIIANAKNGVDQPYFNVKFFKNGKTQITKKKETPQTVSKKITSQKTPPKKESQVYAQALSRPAVYYTDNQLLFEHIIELNAKVDRLTQKHKKLKRRYQTLQDDLYIDSETEFTTGNDSEEIHQEEPKQEVQSLKEPQQEVQPLKVPTRSVRSVKNGWRSQVAFI